MSTQKEMIDRRGSDRASMKREVWYKILRNNNEEEIGKGTTVNMSSSGVLFSPGQMIDVGSCLELRISWPAPLNANMALKLVVQGTVVRYHDGGAAIEIQHCEFCTQGSQAALISTTIH
jgi:hypothetical protein